MTLSFMAAPQAGSPRRFRRHGWAVALFSSNRAHIWAGSPAAGSARPILATRPRSAASREFYRRIRKEYENESNWKYEKRSEFKGRGHEKNEDTAWTFEPHIAEKVYRDLIREYQVQVGFGQRLDLKHGVEKFDRRIVSIRMESGQTYGGKVFIDATYEGDLMAKVGVVLPYWPRVEQDVWGNA